MFSLFFLFKWGIPEHFADVVVAGVGDLVEAAGEGFQLAAAEGQSVIERPRHTGRSSVGQVLGHTDNVKRMFDC